MSNLNNALDKLDEIRLGYDVLQELLSQVPPTLEINANNLSHLVASLNTQLRQCSLELEQCVPVPPSQPAKD